MQHTFRFLAVTGILLLSAGVAMAGTKVSGSIVPHDVAGHPQVSAKSKYTLKGKDGSYIIKLKGVTNAAGLPAPVTSGTTSDTQYLVIVRIDAQGLIVNYNIPFNIAKEGQATVKGAVGLISLVPGAAAGVTAVSVYEPTSMANAADCDAILGNVDLPGVHLGDTDTNPCAGGARLGISGIVAGD